MKTTIYNILTENTGTHFLDSGGDNGRKWQQNRKRTIEDFQNEPRVVAEIYDNEVECVTVSTFHYLNEILERDQFSDAVNAWIEKKDVHWCTDEIFDKFHLHHFKNFGTVDNFSESFNTYNSENNLDHVLQYRTFTKGDEVYVLLQIHLGADVRGGYSKVRCFKLVGLITGLVDVYGSYEDIELSTTYDGYNLTDDNGNKLHELIDNEIDESKLSLDLRTSQLTILNKYYYGTTYIYYYKRFRTIHKEIFFKR